MAVSTTGRQLSFTRRNRPCASVNSASESHAVNGVCAHTVTHANGRPLGATTTPSSGPTLEVFSPTSSSNGTQVGSSPRRWSPPGRARRCREPSRARLPPLHRSGRAPPPVRDQRQARRLFESASAPDKATPAISSTDTSLISVPPRRPRSAPSMTGSSRTYDERLPERSSGTLAQRRSHRSAVSGSSASSTSTFWVSKSSGGCFSDGARYTSSPALFTATSRTTQPASSISVRSSNQSSERLAMSVRVHVCRELDLTVVHPPHLVSTRGRHEGRYAVVGSRQRRVGSGAWTGEIRSNTAGWIVASPPFSTTYTRVRPSGLSTTSRDSRRFHPAMIRTVHATASPLAMARPLTSHTPSRARRRRHVQPARSSSVRLRATRPPLPRHRPRIPLRCGVADTAPKEARNSLE